MLYKATVYFVDSEGVEDQVVYSLQEDGFTPNGVRNLFLQDYGDFISEIIEIVISDSESDEADYDESMDGDFDSGMASAGYGTDEDYGGDCESI